MIYLLYSLDNEIINKYINKIISKEKIDENSIIKYNLDEDSVNDIIEECNTKGLFSVKKLVIVEATNIFSSKGKEITELNSYLDNYNKDIIMIFTCNLDKLDTRKKIYKKIKDIAKIESFNKDNKYLVKLVIDLLNDYKMNEIDINYFISKVGTNINNIENELDKLKSYKYSDKIINKNDIDLLCDNNVEDEIYSLTDAIINNNKNKAIKLYRVFLNKNYDVFQMIGLLASQFRFLLQVKLLYNNNKSNDEIANTLEVHPYRVKMAIRDCYYYDIDILSNYLVDLCELDNKIKSGLVDKNLFFELFILK